VISGNGNQGIILSVPGTSNNLIQGNFIGLAASGLGAIPNGFSGVEIYNGPLGNVIGGGPGARNFISGNNKYAVAIDFGSALNFVQGNSIGLNLTNGPAPNVYAGVAMFAGAVSNRVGGIANGLANTIAYNLSDGIDLYDASTTNNILRGNSIFG